MSKKKAPVRLVRIENVEPQSMTMVDTVDVDAIKRGLTERSDCLDLLKRVEWIHPDDAKQTTFGLCPVCNYPKPQHAPGCELAAMIARLST